MAIENPTRINLINTKKKIAMAKKGYSILKRKREVLVLEFMKMIKESKKDRGYLYSILQPAYKTVSIASTYVGTFELEEVAMHMKEVSPIGMSVKNIMGVRVPAITMGNVQTETTYRLLSTSVSIDDIRSSFSEVVTTLIAVAQREQGLKRIVLEIEKTKRRVNALDYIVIPSMKARSKYIAMRLDEMDRDMFSALKHVKKKLDRAEEAEAVRASAS